MRVPVLGIDVGQSLGWSALDKVDHALGYGTINLDTSASYRERLDRIDGLFAAWDPIAVCLENVSFGRFPMATASYWRLRTLIELQLECRGWLDRLRLVEVSTLKKWATGDGKAKKPQMCAAANSRFGVDLRARVAGMRGAGSKAHEDIADALLAGAWWLEVGAHAPAKPTKARRVKRKA
jgi:Holliday junction resolvasome RuvABC endonuclease subunit